MVPEDEEWKHHGSSAPEGLDISSLCLSFPIWEAEELLSTVRPQCCAPGLVSLCSTCWKNYRDFQLHHPLSLELATQQKG